MTDAAPNADPLSGLRDMIRDWHLADEQSVLDHLKTKAAISVNARANMSDRARDLIEDIRADGQSGLMEVFLTEYGLSTDEGIALMCLAGEWTKHGGHLRRCGPC